MGRKGLAEFCYGGKSTNNAIHAGGSIEGPTTDTIEKIIHDILFTDSKLKVLETAKAMGMSHGPIDSLLNDQKG